MSPRCPKWTGKGTSGRRRGAGDRASSRPRGESRIECTDGHSPRSGRHRPTDGGLLSDWVRNQLEAEILLANRYFNIAVVIPPDFKGNFAVVDGFLTHVVTRAVVDLAIRALVDAEN